MLPTAGSTLQGGEVEGGNEEEWQLGPRFLGKAGVESREVSASGGWKMCDPFHHQASQKSREGQGNRKNGSWILRVVHLLKCCRLK